MPLSRDEQIRQTQEHIYEVNGLQQSGFFGTARSIFWLTAGYFIDYEKFKLYKRTLYFVMEKQRQEKEQKEQEEEKEEEKEEEEKEN
jgi:D-alanyl-D-alanine carboxypeptidase